MNILAVVGAGRKSGKTTTVERLVKELSSRGFNVGTIKQIHEENFSIDKEGKDTWRHIKAGAKIVVSAAPKEVCAIKKIKGNRFKEALHLLESESMDYIVVEGDPKITMPRILAVRTRKEALRLLKEQEHVICISSLSPDKVKGSDVKKPVINPKENIKKIADLVVKVFKRLVPIAGG